MGTMLGLSTMAFSGASASAAAMLPLSPTASGEANAAGAGIVQVKDSNNYNKWNYNGQWKHKNKCYEYGDCNRKHHRKHRRHHSDRFDRSDLYLPFIIGGAFAAGNYYDYGYDDYDYDDGGSMSSRHVRYCLNKYKSYNPRNNTWVAYSGQVKKCYSPYL